MPPSELYIAPTWSWASFLGAVKVNTVNRADAEILDCAVDPLNSEAPLGQIRSGHLKIRAVAVNSRLPRSKQKFSDFEITMDYKTQFGEETDVLYILLGFENEESWRRRMVGLVLSGNPDGTYSRIGQFRSSRTLDAMPVEKNDTCHRRTLTLV